MELKKYKKKRITPQGWREITLAEVFNTSSGATPLSTEASYYENGTIPWINSGELASPYIYDTTILYHRLDLKIQVLRYTLLIRCL